MKNTDVIIIGAGAAGLCAMRAGQRGKRVVLLDHAQEPGTKIIISGGGRCNFTNLHATPDKFFSNNPHFCISALKNYTQHDFIALVQKHKIAYHEKTLGQLFCDRSAHDILNMLLEECRAVKVDLQLAAQISDVSKSDGFTVVSSKGAWHAPALVLATGGLSIPKMGATDFAHRMAKRFGLPLTDIRPGLVPLTFQNETLEFMRALSGVSTEVIAWQGKKKFREGMVFTHRGISGPAILQISSVWREGQSITLDMLPNADAEGFLLERKKARPNAELKTILSEMLSQRLAQAFTGMYFNNAAIGTMTDKALKDVAKLLKQWVLTPSGSEGYAKAEVTLGGIDTNALSSKTMQAMGVPGLYVIGEAVDVTGWLGGYNFQWAWSSGWACGSSV
ncbi:MAG: NAD(P)/FAD-dependent oxidoreductase [Alphaproteobacteria bacterium]|nr:NAD(P)/FAD-dependent oxidoreductase [Alphaproteobacteria bacterium]